MNVNSILALTDFSTESNWALERAAKLAVRHRATLKLMSLPAAGEQAHLSAAAGLADVARELAQRHELNARPVAQVARNFAHLTEVAGGVDLVVLAHRRERTMATFLRGDFAERLARLCHCPVLAVKGVPRQRYRRVLVAVDLTPESGTLAEVASGIDTQAEVALFHALGAHTDITLRASDVPAQIIESYRERRVRAARGRMVRFTNSLDTRRNRVLHTIGRGDPGRQAAVQQQYDGADLVVVGKRRAWALMDFISDNTARQVLRLATSDVLVVPYEARSTARRALARDAAPRPGGRKPAPMLARRGAS